MQYILQFRKLSGQIFRNKDLTTKTKIMMYVAVVISTLLNGCQTWALICCSLKKKAGSFSSKEAPFCVEDILEELHYN